MDLSRLGSQKLHVLQICRSAGDIELVRATGREIRGDIEPALLFAKRHCCSGAYLADGYINANRGRHHRKSR